MPKGFRLLGIRAGKTDADGHMAARSYPRLAARSNDPAALAQPTTVLHNFTGAKIFLILFHKRLSLFYLRWSCFLIFFLSDILYNRDIVFLLRPPSLWAASVKWCFF